MKKTLYILAAAIMIGASSCNDVLDQRSTTQFLPEDIWGDETAAEGYVIASYQTFADHSNNYNINGNKFYDAFSDIAKSTAWDQYEHMYNKTWMLTNSFGKNNAGVFNCWGTEYGRIRRANRLLNEIDEYGVTRYGEDWCKVRRAEVRFCRAISYFFLARVYGGVVIRTDKSGYDGKMDDGKYEADVNRARVSEADTYDFIINEMLAAIEDLPNEWTELEKSEGHTAGWGEKYKGRATKGMVYGFLSRVGLYAKRWDVVVDAADKCKQLGKYELVNDYAHLFNQKYDAENRKEVIYAIYGKALIKMNDYDLQMRPFSDVNRISNVCARIVPTAELADMYEFKDGIEFDWIDYSWDYDDPYTEREPRFQATILYDGAQWEGRTIETYVGNGCADGADSYLEYQNAGSTNGHTPTGYYFRKYLMEGEEITSTNRSYNTENILRYAEVILNKAEAQAELGDIPAALTTLNQVRQRVNLPGKTMAKVKDYDGFMKLLRRERCCELAGEGLRFWDLRRWDMAREIIDGKNVHGTLVTKNPSGLKTYKEIDADGGSKRVYQERYKYFSLPSSEVNNNRLCVDNPGW
ncbi:MAG: RagB/SusD family nutrient uptake outer membrane protein [Clostridiales bacterium]|nr:RagB/SusD family nutrient uptake outer membrane protein [Clostridiales bacterium]